MASAAVAPTYEQLEDESLSLAQRSINLPEVQEMLKKLSAYNLGVYMPHIHDDEGAFHAMPKGVVQVEDDLQVSFRSESEVASIKSMVPVAWTWEDNGATVGATCRTWCLPSNEGGRPVHKRPHNQGY